MGNDCPDERRFGEIEKKVSSMDHRLRNVEQTQAILTNIATNQDKRADQQDERSEKIDKLLERHTVTLYGEDDHPGIVGHVHNIRESLGNVKKVVATFIGAVVTAAVGAVATFFGSKQ